VIIPRGIHRPVLGDAEERVYAKEYGRRCLRYSAQRGGVARCGCGAPGHSSSGGGLIDESGDEPVPADTDGHAVRGCSGGSVRSLDVRAEYGALRVDDEQREHEQSSRDLHESLGEERVGKAAIERRKRTTYRSLVTTGQLITKFLIILFAGGIIDYR